MYSALPKISGCSCSQGMGNIDLSSLNWEDYFVIGMVGMIGFALISPDSSLFNPKPKRRKARRRVKASTGFAGGLVTAAILAGGGYWAYKYLTDSAGE